MQRWRPSRRRKSAAYAVALTSAARDQRARYAVERAWSRVRRDRPAGRGAEHIARWSRQPADSPSRWRLFKALAADSSISEACKQPSAVGLWTYEVWTFATDSADSGEIVAISLTAFKGGYIFETGRD